MTSDVESGQWTTIHVVAAEPILLLYRTMKEVSGNGPQPGESARTLGVRGGVGYGTDIAVDSEGFVRPRTGGLSVAPNNPAYLPNIRLPRTMGGRSPDPLWSLRVEDLGYPLVFRPDPLNPLRHGFIEPARVMPLDELQHLIHATGSRWVPVL
jgi:hypothetical protein